MRLDLPLHHAAAGRSHRGLVRLSRDSDRIAHRGEFLRTLEQTRLVDELARIEQRVRSGAEPRTHRLRGAQQFQDACIHALVDTERVVDAIDLIEMAAQDAIEVVEREGVVGAEIGDRTLEAGAAAGPGLTLLVARAHEEDELFRRIRNEQGDRFRFGESGQVVEIVVLAVDEFDIARAHGDRRARHDGNGAGSDSVDEALAAVGENCGVGDCSQAG